MLFIHTHIHTQSKNLHCIQQQCHLRRHTPWWSWQRYPTSQAGSRWRGQPLASKPAAAYQQWGLQLKHTGRVYYHHPYTELAICQIGYSVYPQAPAVIINFRVNTQTSKSMWVPFNVYSFLGFFLCRYDKWNKMNNKCPILCRLLLTVQSAPSSDVAGVEVGQQSPSSRDAPQLYLVTQSHRLWQLDKCNIIAKRQRWEVAKWHNWYFSSNSDVGSYIENEFNYKLSECSFFPYPKATKMGFHFSCTTIFSGRMALEPASSSTRLCLPTNTL